MEEAADSDAAVTWTTALYITCILLVLGHLHSNILSATPSPLSDAHTTVGASGGTHLFKVSQPCPSVTSAHPPIKEVARRSCPPWGKRTEFSLSPNVMWPREGITINRSHAKQCGPANFIPVDSLFLPLFLPRSSPSSFETFSRFLSRLLSRIRTREAVIAGPRGP